MEREGGHHLRVRRATSMDVVSKDAGCSHLDHTRNQQCTHNATLESYKSCRSVTIASNSSMHSRVAEIAYTDDEYASLRHSNREEEGPTLRVRPQTSFNSGNNYKEGSGGKPPLHNTNATKFDIEDENTEASRSTRVRACAVLAPGAYKETAINSTGLPLEDLASTGEENLNDSAKWVGKLLRFVQKNGQDLLHLVCNR